MFLVLVIGGGIDDPSLPIHLLVFAIQAGMTTLTCIADYLAWEDFGLQEKGRLGLLYVPYLALGEFFPFLLGDGRFCGEGWEWFFGEGKDRENYG